MLVLAIFLLIVGFVILVKGADIFVDGAKAIALHAKISPLIVGMTIVAFATSVPELAVNVTSAAQGETGLAIGNILGSNIANIGLILGVTVILMPLVVKGSTVSREIPFMILSLLVLLAIVSDAILSSGNFYVISRGEGIILLLFFAIFIYYTIQSILKEKHGLFGEKEEIPKEEEEPMISKTRSVLYLIFGLLGLIVGSRIVVDNSLKIADIAGLTETLVGLTIIALGTSLPELAASAAAAFKKSADLAVGNIIGSNIFNVFLVLGITAVITPVQFDVYLYADLFILLALSLYLFLFLITHHHTLRRWEGLFLLISYFSFLLFVVARG